MDFITDGFLLFSLSCTNFALCRHVHATHALRPDAFAPVVMQQRSRAAFATIEPPALGPDVVAFVCDSQAWPDGSHRCMREAQIDFGGRGTISALCSVRFADASLR